MGILVHHEPADRSVLWNMHVWQAAWDGNNVWDSSGTPSDDMVDFRLPDSPDPRRLQFKFHSTSPATRQQVWEADDFTRRLHALSPTEVWTFESSPRILYQNPCPAGVAFNPGNVLTFQVITQRAFRGGQLYVWNPYDASVQPAYFGESSRDDDKGVSTFRVTLAPWMTSGFHLKLMQSASSGRAAVWEPDTANRIWRPCDGASLWLKSGQCDVRSRPLALTQAPLEVLYSARMAAPPQLALEDLAEHSTFPLQCTSSREYAGTLFRIATYGVPIYPEASYGVTTLGKIEAPAIPRSFPADPSVPDAVSRFVLGASGWVDSFPAITSIPLSIQQRQPSSFEGGLLVQVSVGNGPPYDTVPAARQPDGTWQATLKLVRNTTTAIELLPKAGDEPKPYAWIDTRRYFTPTETTARLYTSEGVYGVCERRPAQFAEPPDRSALMKAAFGSAVVGAGVFAAKEMPHGVTVLGDEVFFAVHAPHANYAALIRVDDSHRERPVRTEHPMALTHDTLYWWCRLPAAAAPPGTRYRFLLNDDVEVLDPAARAVQDRGSLKTSFGEDPANRSTSWSVVLDEGAVRAIAHARPWQTMGWERFLIYEVHARRFTNLQPGSLLPFDLLADELNTMSRLGQPGYLHQLPATVLGLMPVSEFSTTASWGYDPSYYFALDEFYGGAQAMARFVDAAHASGRGVTLDLVYNHSLGSSLMSIAPDIYRNGDYDGDRMNCGHPMVGEYFRQASVYLLRTFNLDGFRFDDTQTIVRECQGGWEFLAMIRSSLRAAASAEGRPWPYCVAENSATTPWDISSPSSGVVDGQWGIDEVYQIRAASYDSRHDGWNDAGSLKAAMDAPQYWGRPFFQVTRFGESHDMVSGQDPMNVRIAVRPPYGQGFQMAKALGALTLLSNGIPMLFMGQEVGETKAFSFSNNDQWINPQLHDLPPSSATDNTRVLTWFRQLMGLRSDPSKGLQGDANYQVVASANRTVAFSCGCDQRLFAVVTFGTPDQRQDSSWLGLPYGFAYKEIFNSSWPAFQVEFEQERTNGGYDAQIYRGQIINLPWIGAVVFERR